MKAWILALFLSTLVLGAERESQSISLSLLHTNDLHSHFRPEKGQLRLGGVARLKTAIHRIRQENIQKKSGTLLVDGGDWSEGNTYYALGAGTESLRMMEELSYDAVVVGNHDFINGPEVLLQSYQQSSAKLSLLAANLDASHYERNREFRQVIRPYIIKEIQGIRIALIGLSTYEFIYDDFFRPIRILEPFSITHDLVKKLKSQSDLIVVISHNSIAVNKKLLELIPDIDIVIGAHDHKKLTRPIFVKREHTQPGILVEAGCWGKYLGRLDLDFIPGKSFKIKEYRLIQIDDHIPEDPDVLQRIEKLEALLEINHGPIFHDHIAESHIEISRISAQESAIGNLVTDALRWHTGADLAIDHIAFIYQGLPSGNLHSTDLFNVAPGVFNPQTGKTWTTKILPIKGETLNHLINFLYAFRVLGEQGIISTSGIKMTYSPFIKGKSHFDPGPYPNYQYLLFDLKPHLTQFLNSPLALGAKHLLRLNWIVHDMTIRGEKLEPSMTYQMAADEGVIHAIRFLNKIWPNFISLDGLKDTGIETWRLLSHYINAISPVNWRKLSIGDRILTSTADLGAYEGDIQTKTLEKNDDRALLQVSLTTHNFGASAYMGHQALVHIYRNQNGKDTSVDPNWVELGSAKIIPTLSPGTTQKLQWIASVPKDTFQLAFKIQSAETELNLSNNTVSTWITP